MARRSNQPAPACRRPVVAVSRCLLGENVRYDGRNCRLTWIVDVLSEHCDLRGVCPEVEAGLGIPRPPVQLCRSPQGDTLLGRDDRGLDVTPQVTAASRGLLEALGPVDGFILKSRSPSCGVSDTPLFSPSNPGREPELGGGLFARMAAQAQPGVQVVDENSLADEAGRVSFLVGVFRHCCRRLARTDAGS